MAAQIIFYDPEGKVACVWDDMPHDPKAHLPPGYGFIYYEKTTPIGERLGHPIYDWQAAVDKHLGKS